MWVITVGFLVISLITGKKWMSSVAVVIGLIGAFSPFLSDIIAKGWNKLSEILGKIVPNILLSVIFFLFLFPIALLSKLFLKKDALHLKQPAAGTYVDINKVFEKKMFENPW
jgi:hypothetical protein